MFSSVNCDINYLLDAQPRSLILFLLGAEAQIHRNVGLCKPLESTKKREIKISPRQETVVVTQF